jgi:hypothetical protein
MREDPQTIAAWLVQQHGLENARVEVLASVMQAHEQEDNYALSVWRDVKRILAHAELTGPRAPEVVAAIRSGIRSHHPVEDKQDLAAIMKFALIGWRWGS